VEEKERKNTEYRKYLRIKGIFSTSTGREGKAIQTYNSMITYYCGLVAGGNIMGYGIGVMMV